ncbi:helix-turn-helix transcriptional regulator [Bordetella genomosp. 12]|nr:helix-turn-helix transcriptional regulator [Bordetella genomosp. 12]
MGSEIEELARFSSLVELIYEGATAPERWTKDILPSVADYLGSPSCIMYSWLHTPQDGGFFFLHGIDQEQVDLYVQKYYHADLWKLALDSRNLYATGSVLIGDDLVPRRTLLASSFYKECLSRNENMVQLLSGIVFGSESTTSLPTTCSFFRGNHQADFGAIERARLKLLLPHLSRSLGVMQRLRSSELTLATSRAALDRVPSAVLLLDRNGYVTFSNVAATRMLAAEDGLYLRRRLINQKQAELVGATSTTSKAIKAAIQATLSVDPYAVQHFSKSVTVQHLSSRDNYVLQFSALGSHNEFGADSDVFAAIIFISDSAEMVNIDLTALQESYGLTTMEARVAVTLVERASTKDAADALGVSPHTVRTHLKSIYGKLGVDTRTRFVKLMLGLAKQ